MQHVIFEADYVISRGCSITGLVCLPRKISARHYMKLLHLSRVDELYKINFEFNWKQPPTKKSSEITFFWKFFWINLLLHKWLAIVNFDRFAAAIIFFFCEIPKYVQLCNTILSCVQCPVLTGLRVYGNGPAGLPVWPAMVKEDLLGFVWSDIF